MSTRTWYGQIDTDLYQEILRSAIRVDNRFAAKDVLLDGIISSSQQSVHPSEWYPPSLSNGQAGVCLLHLERAKNDGKNRENSVARARDNLLEAVRWTHVEPQTESGIFAGTGSLVTAMREFSKIDATANRQRLALEGNTAQLIRQKIERVTSAPDFKETDFDIISGLSGDLVYLTRIHSDIDIQLENSVFRVIAKALQTEIGMATLMKPDHSGLERSKNLEPYCDLGFAHGSAGLLASLCTIDQGARDAESAEVIQNLINKLTSWYRDTAESDQHGAFWSQTATFGSNGDICVAGVPQMAWCYGAPGVTVGLGAAQHQGCDTFSRHEIVKIHEGCIQRVQKSRVLSPTICHGLSGLALIMMQFSEKYKEYEEFYSSAIESISKDILSRENNTDPFGYQDIDSQGTVIDDPSLITGACGVGLTLFSLISEKRPDWIDTFVPFSTERAAK